MDRFPPPRSARRLNPPSPILERSTQSDFGEGDAYEMNVHPLNRIERVQTPKRSRRPNSPSEISIPIRSPLVDHHTGGRRSQNVSRTTMRQTENGLENYPETTGGKGVMMVDDEEFIGLTTTMPSSADQKRMGRSTRYWQGNTGKADWMRTLNRKNFSDMYLQQRKTVSSWMRWMNSDWKNHFVAMISELIGTTMFLFFGFAGIEVAKQGSTPGASLSLDQLLYISAAFGGSLMVNAWVFFRISGGLFNPAVTFALACLRAVSPVRAVLLIITQLGAGCLAAVLADAIFPGNASVCTTLGSGTSVVQGFFIEMIAAAELVFAIIMLAVEKHRATFLAPLGIGIALFIGHLIAITFTGASMNPARSFGPAAVSGNFPSEHWIYWIAPWVGSGLAVIFYEVFKMLEYEMTNPGQDGDPENDPTQNPDHKIAQNVEERYEETIGRIYGVNPPRRNDSPYDPSPFAGTYTSVPPRKSSGGGLRMRAEDMERQWPLSLHSREQWMNAL